MAVKGMSRVTLKGLLAHKLRLMLTAISVVLGVAFVSGTFVLTDTINHTFDNLFSEVSEGVDVTVRAKSGFGESSGAEVSRDTLPESLLGTVEAAPGVRVAEGTVGGYAQIVKPDGKAITTGGAPTLGFNWATTADLSPLRLRSGRPPERAGEVVIDVQTAKKNKLSVGQSVKILFRTGTGQFTIVGLTGFGEADNLAGATIAAFELRAAQELFAKVGQFDTIDVAGTEATPTVALRTAVQAALPDTAEAVTSDQVADESSTAVKEGLSFFGTFLLTFAGISLFVGSFIIFNTFSILVAQRTRELGLLRALGASRSQVLRSVLIEAFLVGLVSSAIGLGLGVLFAIGLQALLAGFGIDLPATTTQFLPRTVIASFVVGVGVTMAAAVLPARRAAKVSPIAALRDSLSGDGGSLRGRAIAGAITTGVGALALGGGLFGGGDSALALVGLGAALSFLGVAILSPIIARPLAAAIGAPFARKGRTAHKLGRENAMRNPRRTASAAAALMIGLGLVGCVTVLASSIKKSSTEIFDRSLTADFAISTDQFLPSISPKLAEDLAQRPENAAVTELATGQWQLNGAGKSLYGVTPGTVRQTLNVDIKSGDVESLGRGELMVEEQVAQDNRWTVGDVVPMTFARTGTKELRIGATFARNELLGGYVISVQTFDANFTDRLDFVVLTKTAAGVTAEAARSAIEAVAAEYPNVTARNQAEVKAENRKQVDQLLGLVSALLFLAIVIALFGIVNTLALSVLERTRELGLLRAVGMARRQVWTMIRTESIITSVMGAVLGLAVGVIFGWAIVQALADDGIDSLVIPGGTLFSYVIAAGLAGVFAALWPARKAAKLDVLKAITYE